jgi:hypothetical protein
VRAAHTARSAARKIRANTRISFLVYWPLSWTVETLSETVEEEVRVLPEDMRARLARIAMLIEQKALGTKSTLPCPARN